MQRFFSLALAMMVLSSCAAAQQSGMRARDNTQDELNYLSNRVKGYFQPYKPPPPPLPIASSYCYRTMADIVCYRDPQPGAESRLVGYQEPPLSSLNPSSGGQAQHFTTTSGIASNNSVSMMDEERPLASRPLFTLQEHPGNPPPRIREQREVFVGAAPGVASVGQ